ncbi:MAG: type II toxin-antitoxin system Phd/YefM family antitoxin [Acidimicrobiales bacterium]
MVADVLADGHTCDHVGNRSLADVKAHLSELVAQVGAQHDRVTVTVHGRPTAVLVAVEDLESLEETIEILSDNSNLLRALADADADCSRRRRE